MTFDISIHQENSARFMGSISVEKTKESIYGDLRVWNTLQYKMNWVLTCDRILSGKASLFVVDFPPKEDSECITAWNACPTEGMIAFSEVMIEKDGLSDEEMAQEYQDYADTKIYPEVSIWWVDRNSISSFRVNLLSQIG